MPKRSTPDRILWYEGLGFTCIILLSWLHELFDLPIHLIGTNGRAGWRESVSESVLILIVWFLVNRATRQVLARVHYLEGLLRVCAWCRRIGHEDQWLPLEQYFSKSFDVSTSHSICPDCLAKVAPDDSAPRAP